MIELKPGMNDSFISDDKVLMDIVRTHLCYMNEFSKDNDVVYFVVIMESEAEVSDIACEDIDNVNITDNYYELTFITDDCVKVVIVNESMATEAILSKTDISS